MKRILNLFDTKTQALYTIDGASLICRMEEGNMVRETRLKPFQVAILYALFEAHPKPISYEVIEKHLKQYQLTCPDSTRLHRKVSEIRTMLRNLHPKISPNFIQNTRGIGYSLPLSLRSPYGEETYPKSTFKNKILEKSCQKLEELIHQTIHLTKNARVIKRDDIFILDRNPFKEELFHQVESFETIIQTILKEIHAHPADFIALRLKHLLAKLGTYIGLARVSEYPISLNSWRDWFSQEVWALLHEIKQVMKESENN